MKAAHATAQREEVPIRSNGYIFEKLELLGRGLAGFLIWVGGLIVPTTANEAMEEHKGVRMSSQLPSDTEPSRGAEKGSQELPLGRKVVNAAHSLIDHLGQEAAAVSETLKTEADDFRGVHTMHTEQQHKEPATDAVKPAEGQHMSVAKAVVNAVHSTLDHLSQETAAVSETIKEELGEFQHHQQPSRSGSGGSEDKTPPARTIS